MNNYDLRINALKIASQAFSTNSPEELIELSKPIETYIRQLDYRNPDKLGFLPFCKELTLNTVNGKIKFFPTEKQKILISSLTNNRYVVCAEKERQTGISSVMLAYALYLALYDDYQHIAVIYDKFSLAKNAKKIICDMYKPNLINNVNTSSIEFTNNSIIRFVSQPDHLRGISLSALIMDNVEFFSNKDSVQIINEIFPVVFSGSTTRIIAATTGKEKYQSDMMNYLLNNKDFNFNIVR